MLWTCSSKAFFQFLRVFQIQVFPFFFFFADVGFKTRQFISAQILKGHCKHTSILIQIARNMFWMVLKYVQVIVPKKST